MKAILVLEGRIYYSKRALKAELELPESTLFKWRKAGIIPEPATRIGKTPYWDMEAVDRALAERK